MSQAIMAKEKNEVAAQEFMDQWGPAPISQKDIIIPRLNLMQPVSEQVTEGNAAFGEFRNSLTGEKIGDFKTTFEFVPFHMRKVFVEYDVSDEKDKKYLRTVPITPGNEQLPYQDTEKTPEGKTIPISRDYVMNFYGLLPAEAKRGGELPLILSFRRTSLQQGKKLATQMYVTNRGSMLPPPGLTITVGVIKQSNDKSTWCIPEVRLDTGSTKVTTPDVMVKALNWFKMISNNEVRDDEASLVKEVQAEAKVESKPTKNGPKEF
jgi:hypothetical protein